MTPFLPNGPDETPIMIYNPDIEDFSFVLADDNNIQHTYKLMALEFTNLPKYIADHGARKLAHYLLSKRGIKTNYELELKHVMEEIYS